MFAETWTKTGSGSPGSVRFPADFQIFVSLARACQSHPRECGMGQDFRPFNPEIRSTTVGPSTVSKSFKQEDSDMGKRGRKKHAARRPRHQPAQVQITIQHVVSRPRRGGGWNNRFKHRDRAPRHRSVDRSQRKSNDSDDPSDDRRQSSVPSSTNPLAPPEWLSHWTYSTLQALHAEGQETRSQLRYLRGSIQELHQGFCPNAME